MTPSSVPHVHAEVVRALRRGVRMGLAALVGAWLLTVGVVAWVWSGAEGWDAGSNGPLVLDLLLLLGAGIALFFLRRWMRRTGDEAQVSAAIEGASGLERGVVQGALELARDLPAGVSPSLAGRMQQRALSELNQPTTELAGTLGVEVERMRRVGGIAVGGLLALTLLLVGLDAGRSGSAWRGLAAPLSVLEGPRFPPLVVPAGDVDVIRGGDVVVEIEAPLRQRLRIEWREQGALPGGEEIEVVDGRASRRFEDVTAEVVWSATSPDGAATEEYRITPVDPLFVGDVTVRLDYPSYTGRAQEEFRGDVPALTVPEGTSVDVRGRGNRPLARAGLVGGDVVEFIVDGAEFSGRFVPVEGGEYGWAFEDIDGGTAASAPEPITLAVVPDLPPSVRLAAPSPDTLLPIELQQPLRIEAEDDWGLATLELVAWRVDALGEAGPERRQTLELGGAPAIRVQPVLDVRSWSLVPGDEVRYWVRVVDTHPEGRAARTPEAVLRMPEPTELRRDAQLRLEDAARRLEELTGRADEAAEDARQLERMSDAPPRSEAGERSGESPTGSFEEREQVRSALEEQQALMQEAATLREELDALSDALTEAGATEAELDDDLEELRNALDQLGGEELQARMEELLAESGEMDRDTARDALEQLTSEQEDFRDRLEDALERARRAAVEQELRNTAREAGELAQEQRLLAEALDAEEEPSARADQQDALAEEAAEMAERMDELGDELLEVGEPEAQAGLDRAREATTEALDAMRQAGQQAQGGDPNASESAQQAAEAMQAAAEAMQAARDGMMEDRAAGFEAALRRGAQDALALARRQGEVQDRMRGATPDELAALRGEVAAVRQGLGNLSENLDLAARLAGADVREISARTGAALESLDGTVGALDSGPNTRPSPLTSSERSIATLNEVALSALAAARAMQEGASSSGSSSEEQMEQMQDLAQQQADVNNQAAQTLPMQLPQQQMQEQMQQMAQQQQQIAADLGQMSQQEGEDGPLGDLEAMAREAEALAQELQGGRLEPDTRRRQERLFHRLLDAGRSLQKEEESTERESEAASAFDAAAPETLDPGALGLLRFGPPDAATLNRLPPAARALVIRYFQRLNDRNRTGGGGG